MNELTAGGAPRDPLLGWAGLDASGRIVSLGGRVDALHPGLQVGLRLADALRDPEACDRFVAAAGRGAPGEPACVQCLMARWAQAVRLTPGATGDAGDAGDARAAGAQAAEPAPAPGRAPAAAFADASAFELRLRPAWPASGPVRIAAEFHRAAANERPTAPGAALPSTVAAAVASSLAPLPVAAGRPEAADLWRLGSALYAATVALQPNRPAGLIRFALHPVPLPRLPAVDDLDPWIEAALARLASSAAQLGTEAVAARTGTRELTVWMSEGSGCAALCAHWLAAMTASPLVGSRCRLVVGPAASWCVMPADGTVLGYLLDALDAVYEPGDARTPRLPIAVGSRAREHDIDERREALTGTLVELAASGRARLAAEPIVDAPTGLAAGLHLRAEFRSLFAVADLVDYLPDVVEDDAAADALNAWLAAALRSGALPPGPALAHGLQLRIAPVQLRRIRSLAPVVVALLEAGGGTAPCLMLPEAAVHRDAYLVIDAAPEVAALGATLGIDDYRGLLPPQQLAQAGIGVLRLHRSLVRELGERAFAGDRLSDLLARARAVDLSVLVTGLADRTAVGAAAAAGALQLSGPVFGRPQRLAASLQSRPSQI